MPTGLDDAQTTHPRPQHLLPFSQASIRCWAPFSPDDQSLHTECKVKLMLGFQQWNKFPIRDYQGVQQELLQNPKFEHKMSQFSQYWVS